MLFVLNKEKIYAYIVSVLTVVILFCVTQTFKDEPQNTVSTSANIQTENTSKPLNITNITNK